MMHKVPTDLVEEAAEIGAIRYIKRDDGVMRVVVVGIGYLYGLDSGSKPRMEKGLLVSAAKKAGARLVYYVMQDVQTPSGVYTVKRVYNTFDEAWAIEEKSDD